VDSIIRERIALLCDEMLRRGVPRPVVQHVVDWLDTQRPGVVVALPDDAGHAWTPDMVCALCGFRAVSTLLGGLCAGNRATDRANVARKDGGA
jgi:hypothetical protein